MNQELASQSKVVGVKQSRKAIQENRAAKVYFGADADPMVVAPLVRACEEQGIATDFSRKCDELGRLCRISVSAAVVTLLKD